jgi:hypothetical protein
VDLAHCLRRDGPCLRAGQSPSPRKFTPVLSTRRFEGLPERR